MLRTAVRCAPKKKSASRTTLCALNSPSISYANLAFSHNTPKRNQDDVFYKACEDVITVRHLHFHVLANIISHQAYNMKLSNPGSSSCLHRSWSERNAISTGLARPEEDQEFEERPRICKQSRTAPGLRVRGSESMCPCQRGWTVADEHGDV